MGERFDFDPATGLADAERQLGGALTALNRLVRDKAVEAGQDIEKTFKAAYDAISSGVPVDDLELFLTKASNLAIGGVSDISKATKLLLSVFQTTGRDVTQLNDQTDSLFTLVRLGRTTIDELSGSLGRVLPIAQAAGVSIDEVGGAISALSAGGLTTAEAVTALRQVLNKIINPSVASAELARKLGIDLSTAAIRSKGLKGVLEEIAIASKSNTDVIGNLFPRVRALVGVLSLLRGEGTRTLDDFFDPFQNAAGATNTAVGRISKTFTFTVNQLKTSFQSLRAEIFEAFLPQLREFAASARNLLGAVFDPFRQGADLVGRLQFNIQERVARGDITQEQANVASEFLNEARQEQLRNITNGFLGQLQKLAQALINFLGATIQNAINFFVDVITSPGPFREQLFETFQAAFGFLTDIGLTFLAGLGKVFATAINLLTDALAEAFPDIFKPGFGRARAPVTGATARSQLALLARQDPDTKRGQSQLIEDIRNGISAGLIQGEVAKYLAT